MSFYYATQCNMKIKKTWRLAGTGLAAVQTVCHVLPGINMRELNRPLRVWFLPPLLLESVENTHLSYNCFPAFIFGF